MQVKMNTNRKYYRIELPAKASINNTTYTVKDWSLGGFMIVDVPDVFREWLARNSQAFVAVRRRRNLG